MTENTTISDTLRIIEIVKIMEASGINENNWNSCDFGEGIDIAIEANEVRVENYIRDLMKTLLSGEVSLNEWNIIIARTWFDKNCLGANND